MAAVGLSLSWTVGTATVRIRLRIQPGRDNFLKAVADSRRHAKAHAGRRQLARLTIATKFHDSLVGRLMRAIIPHMPSVCAMRKWLSCYRTER